GVGTGSSINTYGVFGQGLTGGVWGSNGSSASTSFGVKGTVNNGSTANMGVFGSFNGASAPGLANGAGVAGSNSSSGGVGVIGQGDIGVKGIGTGAQPVGVWGQGSQTGVYGYNTAGTAVVGDGSL